MHNVAQYLGEEKERSEKEDTVNGGKVKKSMNIWQVLF
jgi:hypothetical protein